MNLNKQKYFIPVFILNLLYLLMSGGLTLLSFCKVSLLQVIHHLLLSLFPFRAKIQLLSPFICSFGFRKVFVEKWGPKLNPFFFHLVLPVVVLGQEWEYRVCIPIPWAAYALFPLQSAWMLG